MSVSPRTPPPSSPPPLSPPPEEVAAPTPPPPPPPSLPQQPEAPPAQPEASSQPAGPYSSGFNFGITPRRRRRPLYSTQPRPSRRRRNTPSSESTTEPTPDSPELSLRFWEDRCVTPPAEGKIRLLGQPNASDGFLMFQWWAKDRSITEWHEEFNRIQSEYDTRHMNSLFYPANYLNTVRMLFYENQRKRWLAFKVINRIRHRIWMRRPQCDVDLIEMSPVPDNEAIYLTDSTHKQVYRFHRRDIYSSLMSNICLSSEMLPTPRAPTNPWTNSPLTLGQTIAVCQQILSYFARRGTCPPVLFSAFWAARFNIRKFQQENAPALAQHAITVYFKDIHEHNVETIYDTMIQLLGEAGCRYLSVAVRRFLRQTPVTQAHRDWLALVRDYTLYMNLHVQVRRHWFTDDQIYNDVRQLFRATEFPETVSPRIRLLRTAGGTGEPVPTPAATAAERVAAQAIRSVGLLQFPRILAPPSLPSSLDVSGSNIMEMELALQLIQSSLFRL